MGRVQLPVEQIKVADIGGKVLKAVAEFRYLGTIASSNGRSSQEINRRLALGSSVFARLGKIWMRKDLTLNMKCDLYYAIVMTVLLYNGECWVTRPRDLERLEGFHFRCLRRITRNVRCPGMKDDCKIDRASHEEVFGVSRMPKIEDMLREKRLRWFGHLTREQKDDPAKETLWREMDSGGKSKWWAQVENDLKIKLKVKKVSIEKVLEKAKDRGVWRQLSSSRHEAPLRASVHHNLENKRGRRKKAARSTRAK